MSRLSKALKRLEKTLDRVEMSAAALGYALGDAIIAGDEKALRRALANGADPNALYTVSNDGVSLEMPMLHWAASFSRESMIAPLVQAGANIQAVDTKQASALARAVLSKATPATLALLAIHGGRLESRRFGYTPLQEAVTHADAAQIETLLQLGADVNAWGLDGRNAVLQLLLRAHVRLVDDDAFRRLDLLLDAGADAAGKDQHGNVWDDTQDPAMRHRMAQAITDTAKEVERFEALDPRERLSVYFPDEAPSPAFNRMLGMGWLPVLLDPVCWQTSPEIAKTIWKNVGEYYQRRHEDVDLTFAVPDPLEVQKQDWARKIRQASLPLSKGSR